MLDRNQERVMGSVMSRIAPAIVLDLDDERLQLANVRVEKQRSEERVILAVFSLIADKNSQDAAGADRVKQSLHRSVQLKLKLFKGLAVAQVLRVIGVADNIPVGRVVPDKVELSFGQRAGKDMHTLPA